MTRPETPGAGVGEARIVVPPNAAVGSVVHVRALISHPMDTGLFRTIDGRPIPAYFVTEVVVRYGEEQIARFEWTSGLSRDPFFTFPLRVMRAAPITITWKDNRGGVYTQSAPVTVAT
jgi:sulfur-oxidizing protein SoxZ